MNCENCRNNNHGICDIYHDPTYGISPCKDYNPKYIIKVKDHMPQKPRLRRRIIANNGEWLPIITIDTKEGKQK